MPSTGDDYIDPNNPFIVGIRSVINSRFPSQASFAKGVTSTVNLSNVLRGQGGTSAKMRKKLCDKAGMSVEEVISLGKQLLNPNNSSAYEMLNGVDDPSVTVSEMSTAELMDKSTQMELRVTADIAKFTRSTSNVISALASDRDKMIDLLHEGQAVLNAIDDRVKVVDRNLKITMCNRATTEYSQQTVGDSCEGEYCTKCSEASPICFIQQVFTSGKTLRTLIHTDTSRWESRVFYPQLAANGLVDRVVIIIRDITGFITQMQNLDSTTGINEPVLINQ